MSTPDGKTADNTLPPAPASIPIEKLMDSMKPETPLVIEGSGGGFGAGSTSQATSSSSTTSSAPSAPSPPSP
jgi:hypothetical protein